MKRIGLTAILAVACMGAALAQSTAPNLAEEAVKRHTTPPAPKPAPALLTWNPHSTVLFKGDIRGIQVSAPLSDGKSWVSLLVKLSNGGTALVELGPKDYVDAQGLRFRMKSSIWVAGSKVFTPNGDSVIMAQRINYDEMRPSFRKADGSPFWAK